MDSTACTLPCKGCSGSYLTVARWDNPFPPSSARSSGSEIAHPGFFANLSAKFSNFFHSAKSLWTCDCPRCKKPVKIQLPVTFFGDMEPQPWGFPKLPGELRNRIYELAFPGITNEDVFLTMSRRRSSEKSSNLIRTCRQVYHEVHHLLNERRVFRVFPYPTSHMSVLDSCTTPPCKAQARLLKRIGKLSDDVPSKRCPFCKLVDLSIRHLHRTQLESIKRIFVSDRITHALSFLQSHQLQTGKVGLKPEELFLQLCTCSCDCYVNGETLLLIMERILGYFPTVDRIFCLIDSTSCNNAASLMSNAVRNQNKLAIRWLIEQGAESNKLGITFFDIQQCRKKPPKKVAVELFDYATCEHLCAYPEASFVDPTHSPLIKIEAL